MLNFVVIFTELLSISGQNNVKIFALLILTFIIFKKINKKGQLKMPKKCTNVRKRKDNRWEGRVKIGKYPNGATKYRSVYGKTYEEVREKLNIINEELDKVKNDISNDMTFEDVLNMWFSSAKISIKKSTAYRYEYLMSRHIIPSLGHVKISDVNSALINSFLGEKLNSGGIREKEGLSSSYVKCMLNIIKSAAEFAVAEDLCSPFKAKISKPQEEKSELVILSHEEQQRFVNYAKNNLGLTELGMLISLYSGLRIGEVCALRWEDIDLKNNVIHVRHTVSRIRSESESISNCLNSELIMDRPKTKASQRDVPIVSALMPYLFSAQANAVSEFVVSEKTTFTSPRTFEYRYHRVLQKCGIKKINYHALRHTFATRCVEAGVDVKSLSEMLGHSNVSITLSTYVHSSMELKRMQIEKLSALCI